MNSVPSQPLVSIITVTFNAEQHLEKTIESVAMQYGAQKEHIIIDGGSTDATKEIIEKHREKITYWISEPDAGIYDAMNKGLRVAKGEYILFLNAGDTLYEPSTLENIFASGNNNADIYYGDTVIVTRSGQLIGPRRLSPPETIDWKSFADGMVVCHQSVLVKRSIAPYYNISYHYAADIDWLIRAAKSAHTIVNTKRVISTFMSGGFSEQHIPASLKERFLIMSHYYGFFSTLARNILLGIRFLFFVAKHKRI